MSSGHQIAAWAAAHKVVGFVGVFCADQLPTERPRPGQRIALVINHSRCGWGDGTHWLAAVLWDDARRGGMCCDWFDSYGVGPDAKVEEAVMTPRMPPPNFSAWLRGMGVSPARLTWNTRDLQSVASDVCGNYACYFLKHGLPQFNPAAWSWLSSSVTRNDQEIARLVRFNAPPPRAERARASGAGQQVPQLVGGPHRRERLGEGGGGELVEGGHHR